MTDVLLSLIRKASTELGSTACQAGKHQWAFDGGRPCPHDIDDNCSQAVYQCRVCGTHDYGDPGGPGEADCEHHCKNRFEREISIANRKTDPLGFAWWNYFNGNCSSESRAPIHRRRLAALRRQPKPTLP
ncbi:MAG: hypothetical protein Q7U48_13690 [Hydrogenophaga sp.]|nr:hypothetical protein [Hydrogenophaga sp.]